jgi:acyl-CoA thioesterase
MKTNQAEAIVNHMMAHDAFSQWLGIEVSAIEPGSARLQMTVRPEMTNGFAIAHGGITYALADSALAFASNGYGPQAVSLETSISHLKPLQAGDLIVAEAREVHRGHKTGIYEVRVTCGEILVAQFKGIVYITSKNWNL